MLSALRRGWARGVPGLALALLLAGCAGPGRVPASPTGGAGAASSGLPGPVPSGPPPATPPSAPAAPVVVKAGAVYALTDSPIFMALERGYFEEAGIRLDLQQFDTVVNAIPAVSTGQLDVAFDGALSAGFLNAIGRGIGIKIVANQGIAAVARADRPYYAIVAAKALVDNGQVQRVADLRGQPVGVLAEGSLAQLLVDTALRSEGLTLADVRQQTLSFPDTLAGLRGGSLAGGFLVEPFITLGRQQGLLEVLLSAEKLAPGREITLVLYSPQFAQQPAATSFMVAYLRGVRDYVQAFFGDGDRAAAVAQLAKHLAVKEPALYERMGLPYVNPDGRVTTADLQAQQAWHVAQGLVAQPVNMESLVDGRFVDYALGVLGPYRP
ncbi:MAG TPA: ABC transporter substrate-binding protein [Chloroflexota bacterium]|nr:ABC transporter substrate-binding protein [Chloroflexota bacterium]